MITRVVVLKVVRAFFYPKVPVEIMVGFFDATGKPVGSQLLDAELFEDDIKEGDSVNFKSKPVIIQNLLADTIPQM